MPASDPSSVRKRTVLAAARYLPLYLACAALAGLLWRRPVVLTLCYAALSAGLLLRWHSRRDLVYYFVPFVLGPAGEALAVSLGAWAYPPPARFLPLWLPFAWGIAMLFMHRVAEAVAAAGRDRS